MVALRLRDVSPADRPHVERAFESLSRATIVSRFLGLVKLTPRLFDWVDQLGDGAHTAVAAVDAASGTPLGLARWVRYAGDSRRAEVAITVIDRWQHRGVGTALLTELACRARREGITTFSATASAENRIARLLLTKLGEPRVGTPAGGVLTMDVALQSDFAYCATSPKST